MRTCAYVDGFNLYYGAVKGTPWRWLDPVVMLERILEPHHDITCVKYFTARVSATPRDPLKPQRQETYLRALSQRMFMPLATPTGRQRTVEVIKTEEKGSDVNLAVHLVNDAWIGAYDCAIVVSNDGDLAEGARVVKQQHTKRIGLLVPGKERRVSHALAKPCAGVATAGSDPRNQHPKTCRVVGEAIDR